MKRVIKFFQFPHSLFFRIVGATFVLAVTGALGRGYFSRYLLEDAITKHELQEQRLNVNFIAGGVEEAMSARKALLLALVQALPIPLIQKPKALENWFSRQTEIKNKFNLGLAYIPADGRGALADFPRLEGRKQLDFSGRDWFLTARDKGEFSVGKPVIDELAFEPVVHMAAPVKNAEGQVIGVLMATTSLRMHDFLLTQNLGSLSIASNFQLISPKDKLIVMDSVGGKVLRPMSLPDGSPFVDRFVNGWRGAAISTDNLGVERWETYASVPSSDWIVVGRFDIAPIQLEASQLSLQFLFFNLSTFFVMITLMGLALKLLLLPLKKFSAKVMLMAKGEIPLGKLTVLNRDEVGDFVYGFNVLVEKLLVNVVQLEHLANHDHLTQLPNRRLFIADLERNCALIKRQRSSLALLYFDLDGFKNINDLHGHPMGDLVLRQVAVRLNNLLRKSDRLARLGGDEFAVVLMDCAGRENIAGAANKLISKLSEPYLIEGLELRVGISMGIGVFPGHTSNIETLIDLTDAAMYVAKRTRGSGFCFVGDAV